MDQLANIINSIKAPLLFISRTKKIDAVKDLEKTMSHLIDKAIALNVTDGQQNLFMECKRCFRDFALLDGASKLKRIEEALRLISHIEIEITSPCWRRRRIVGNRTKGEYSFNSHSVS